jgi:hypothetical protein
MSDLANISTEQRSIYEIFYLFFICSPIKKSWKGKLIVAILFEHDHSNTNPLDAAQEGLDDGNALSIAYTYTTRASMRLKIANTNRLRNFHCESQTQALMHV